MITLDSLKEKVKRRYLPFLQTWLQGEDFQPITFPVGKLPDEFGQLRTVVQTLKAASKAIRGYGYTIEWEVKQKRSLGTQTLPVRIIIETSQDLLRFLEKEEEFALFQKNVVSIRTQLPGLLEEWMVQFPQKVIEHQLYWSELLMVCQYFLSHPRPNLYIRELPIAVHTKFIEQHTAILRELLERILPAEFIEWEASTFQHRFGLREEETWIPVRFLDNQFWTRYNLPITDISLPGSHLSRLRFDKPICFITENKMTFLTLPAYPGGIAIWGGGFRVAALASISWLTECPIIYWGDLDAQGFQILSQLRSLFPHVISAMMDENTLQHFSEFQVTGVPCHIKELPGLTPNEHTLFLFLATNNIRLEQERISHTYALACLQKCLETINTSER